MASDRRDPPTFSVDSSPNSDTSLRSNPRAVTRVDFTCELGNVTLDDSKYYIPTTTTNHFFDSFTIDFDINRTTAKIMRRVGISKKKLGSRLDPRSGGRVNAKSSGRCLLAGTITLPRMTIAVMPFVYAFPYRVPSVYLFRYPPGADGTYRMYFFIIFSVLPAPTVLILHFASFGKTLIT